ncbi:cytochrome P450 [Laetiporus sulphureus 93-53]|uniref:Cytochrome P450 n=1 Tax=Laetiporus sulphureus 93-53 TaxID=1314785 RepID=A0A165IKZ7_9APHY|nr:cytochrome P450 [Laetiporus sulphureus 93-53]KZT13226.1 cytochrome P450 [Laetiporus sulphureus 93-53]
MKEITIINILLGLSVVWITYNSLLYLRRRYRSARATPLTGPPNINLFFGLSRYIGKSKDAAAIYEQWAEEYGPVYHVPAAMGFSRVVLCDPKAVSHFYARETYGFVQTALTKQTIENIVRGLLQRKALSPAFSNAAIRRLTSVFFDSGYKVKTAWDNIIESQSGDSAIIDVQNWMNHVSLDSVGIAGFSHDFGTLHGKRSTVAETFEAFGHVKPSLIIASTFILGLAFPVLAKVPTPFWMLIKRLNDSMGEIAQDMLENTRRESKGENKTEEKSIIGLLIKAENSDSDLSLSQEEVMAQMKVLIIAGYETTSICLSWCLVELCKRPDVQQKLREEVSNFAGGDPTWDQLTYNMPFLDAVVHETLRLHPPVRETTRVAAEDTIFPLSTLMTTPSGEIVDRVAITKGQLVTVPIQCMNTAKALWGPDAKEFRPERWLNEDGIPMRAQEIQGHRHLLTFVDGPRMCLGRGFALAEFKAVLSVLIRNYAFDFKDGPETKIDLVRGILPRPRIEGEEGTRLPLRVRRLE